VRTAPSHSFIAYHVGLLPGVVRIAQLCVDRSQKSRLMLKSGQNGMSAFGTSFTGVETRRGSLE